MKRLIVAVLCTVGTLAHAQAAKKELVQKVLALQQPMIESVSRNIAERPAMQLMQVSGQFIQTQVPADKREALAKQVESDIRKFVDEAVPVLRERALKLAPASALAPLHYSLLLWAVIFGLVFFNDLPDAQIWLGSAVIVLAGLFIFHRQKVVDHAVPPETVPRDVH